MKKNRNKVEKERRKKAYTLLEVVISISILTIILLSAMGAYIFILKDNKTQVYRSLAYKKCQEEIENLLAMSTSSLPSMHNTTFSIDFLEGLPPQNLGKIYVTDISSPPGSGRLYQIKVEIKYNGDTDHPPINVSITAIKAKL